MSGREYVCLSPPLVVGIGMHETDACFHSHPRDGRGMWVDITTLPRVSVNPTDLFNRFGHLDLTWQLGGMLCGAESGFVRPEVRVIEDASKVSRLHLLVDRV